MGESESIELIYSLIGYPSETEWLEFKSSNDDPERIGRDISALANSAAYCGRAYGYKIWGVNDKTHELTGTSFNPYAKKARGNQDLLIWLSKFLSPNANYEFERFEHDGNYFVVLRIKAATERPVSFDRAAYIREGSSTTRLVAGSAKESELWHRLQSTSFELQIAEKDATTDELLELLDVDAYFDLLRIRKPGMMDSVIEALCEQDLVVLQDNGRFAISNLGALLIARRMSAFPQLRIRALRVVRFAGKGSFEILDDHVFDEGYALALPKAEERLMSSMRSEEYVSGAFRRVRPEYPQRAVRELLSNVVIHQDLSDMTMGPLVKLYSNRLEFSNPGVTLIPIRRLLNAQPKTRNTALASCLRQMDLCEEGGSGWDLAVAACEANHMLPPNMRSEEGMGTTVTLYSGNGYERMTKKERKDATYWHACLMYAQGESMGNQTLRERFGLDDSRKNIVAISRLIKECCESGLIKEEDEDAGDRYRRYIPAWA